MKTLKEFLIKNHAYEDGFDFAKDLTLEEFLNTCQRGDWILWLFVRMNPESLRELILAKGHCANTVRELMKGERSLNAVDVAIAFGEGKATREELNAAADAAFAFAAAADAAAFAFPAASDAAFAAASDAAYAAFAAASAAAFAASAAAYAAFAASAAAFAASDAAFAASDAAAAYAASDAAKKENQKLTADICRKYLPLEIWNQNLI
jgi:hypothetical protein